MQKEYFYIDINILDKSITNWGISNTANLTGDTNNPDIHRLFLTKGQFNKLAAKLTA